MTIQPMAGAIVQRVRATAPDTAGEAFSSTTRHPNVLEIIPEWASVAFVGIGKVGNAASNRGKANRSMLRANSEMPEHGRPRERLHSPNST